MTRYFLTRIRVEGFRGINNEGHPLDLKFRPDAVNSVFAVNGIGKSSLFEALAYAISNRVPKLEELQAAERPEDYICNRFHSRRHATIDLEFEPDDGSATIVSIRVERNAAGQRTVSSQSGHADPQGFLASLNENFTLLDYRTFARFIDDSPLERGRSFSALLGLSAYSDVRQCLQAASETRTLNTDLEIRTVSTLIETAQQASQQALTSMLTNHERITGKLFQDVARLDEYLADVGTALGGVELLKPYFDGKALVEVDFDAVKAGIRETEGGEKRKELERVVDTITRIEVLGAANASKATEEQQALTVLLDERDGLLAKTRGALSKKLYEAANDLMEQGEWPDDAKCPLCLSPVGSSIKNHARDWQSPAVATRNPSRCQS
jgi:DNA repair exonuclease SbcCD ATPase subunit